MKANKFLYDAIFLDRDGTLNPDPGYISSIDNFELYSFTIESLKLLSLISPYLFIVTNQSGISRGLIKKKELDKIHSFLLSTFENENIFISRLYICTDLPETGSTRRKPESGMFLEAESEYPINLKNCIMIGDSINDILSGKKLAMDTMLVLTGNGEKTNELFSDELKSDFIVKDLLDGATVLTRMQK